MTGGTLQSLLEQSLGALFVGILVAAILLGITNLQTYVYFKSYPNDWLHYKLAVVFLWCLDTLHFVLAAHAVYWYLVMHFDEISLHLPIVWSFKLQLVLNLLTILMVQSLYAFRLWKVSSSQKRRTAAYLVIALVVCNYGMTTATCYFIYQVHAITDVQHYCWMIYSIYGTGILVDFAIVAAFCWTIAQHRNGHPNSDSIINRLIVYVVASGVLTRHVVRCPLHLG
ncbi:hypothetical protein GLOTRDRAFT_129249 [Gloeophyllum trabeum ATCC 11539]|uniref:DUF6534 domain-containing protein n=1 Tax=Gloeophyllum trabeum (strain ATCC 11539 / FP-39264 / Madison 617) TaxID=670483 RepID=S7RSN7_GLOTA|nr:uncharacterized protein GLOTRDRAFT_129249 [Gloeophyllum trabeum ATCC 11539]EPQ56044.1 hypothetical protein GLOTRDRAFT_129249 [Gloeophyllum trabeum ATCC 11539]